MSNTVKFYTVKDDTIVINKTLGDATTKTGVKIKGDCSVLSPTLVLKYDETLASANYCYIDAPYNRYYYLSPPVLSPGGKMTFMGSVDPLMSWKDDIESLSVIVSRKQRGRYAADSSTKDADYMADTKMPSTVVPSILTIEADYAPFDGSPGLSPGTKQCYVLTVTGGKASS